MPQRIRDFGIAAAAFAAIVAALALIDERVPEYLQVLGEDVASGRVLEANSPLGAVARSLAANPALDNFFVMAMVAAGLGLLLLMVKT